MTKTAACLRDKNSMVHDGCGRVDGCGTAASGARHDVINLCFGSQIRDRCTSAFTPPSPPPPHYSLSHLTLRRNILRYRRPTLLPPSQFGRTIPKTRFGIHDRQSRATMNICPCVRAPLRSRLISRGTHNFRGGWDRPTHILTYTRGLCECVRVFVSDFGPLRTREYIIIL